MSNIIYAITTTSQNVVADSNVPLLTLARRPKCSDMTLINNAIVLSSPGYYKIDGTITFTAVAGTVTVDVLKGGTAIPGITSSLTATGSIIYTLPISGIIRVYCGEQPAPIVLFNSGTDLTVTNVSLSVEKL